MTNVRKSLLVLMAFLLLASGCNKQATLGTNSQPSQPALGAPALSGTDSTQSSPTAVDTYYLQLNSRDGGIVRAGLYQSRTGLVRAVDLGYTFGQPFQFEGGQFYYINYDERLARFDVASGTETVFPWQKVTSFWVDEGLFVYFTQDYCGEGTPCNVVLADLRTLKIIKTIAKNLPKLVDAGPGLVHIAPAKSNDRALALVSGYGDGPGGYSKFWSLGLATGKLDLVVETSYVSVGAVCGEEPGPSTCERARIEADNAKHEMYQAQYVPHNGTCGGNTFVSTNEFYNPGDTWFVGCEGN